MTFHVVREAYTSPIRFVLRFNPVHHVWGSTMLNTCIYGSWDHFPDCVGLYRSV